MTAPPREEPTGPPSQDRTLPRQGPRPLALHLSIALMVLMSSPGGLPFLKNASLPWKPALRGRVSELAAQVIVAERNAAAAGGDGAKRDAFARAVDREMRRRLDLFFTGVERYRHHPYRRILADPPVLWREGSSRLLDYGHEVGTAGRPVLFVPSLVNRAYILDLSARRSLLRWLAQQGLRPLMIDWGMPGALERRYTLTDYVAGRLDRALNATLAATGGRSVAAVGYCMGGMLATALALRRPKDVDALGLLATPWDFFAGDSAANAHLAVRFITLFGPALDLWGEMPVDVLQSMFAQVDPLLALRKFSQFGRLDGTSPHAENFVALEDWLNDGIPLPAAVARDCLAGWYGRNDPANGNWLIAGLPVEPRHLRMPTLALVPANDRIVPPASALALARAIPGAHTLLPPLGHIGMVASAGAVSAAWQPLAGWLAVTGQRCADLP